MRVGIIALLQESNTFINERTTLSHFEQDLLLEGEAVRERMAAAHHEVGGFFAGLEEEKIDAVPIFAARALPFGVMTAETLDALLTRMIESLDNSGSLDGLLVAPHGATVSENVLDVDGHWLSMLRTRLGPRVPIIGTLDPHGNLSPAMVDACDALTAYRTNPHLDQRARGLEAAHLMARTLRGEIRPTMAAAFPPLIVNIACQATSEAPCRPMFELAEEVRARPGVLSASLMLGFPYSDVPEMGAATIAVTNDDATGAQAIANELAQAWWDRRAEFVPELLGIEEAVEKASQLGGPICLLDMGDNVGGGSPADGTLIAHALVKRNIRRAFVCLADPEAVALATAAGEGSTVFLEMGGKSDPARHGPPVKAAVIVRRLTDGRFEEPTPRHGGFTTFDQGPTAIVETANGLTMMLTTRRMAPFSLRQLTTFGVEPAKFQVLVAKGVHAPVAAYEPVCRNLIRVNTPGVTTADLTLLNYRNRRRQMYPLEP